MTSTEGISSRVSGPFLASHYKLLMRFRAIPHNNTRYPDHMEFDPGHFVDQERIMKLRINNFRKLLWVWETVKTSCPLEVGSELPIRRLCPGRWLAVQITIASILIVYTIEKALSEDGAESALRSNTRPLLRSVLFAPLRLSTIPRNALARPKPLFCA